MTKGPIHLDVAVNYAAPRAGVPAAVSFRKWVAAALKGRIYKNPVEVRGFLADERCKLIQHRLAKTHFHLTYDFAVLDLAPLGHDAPNL